MWALLIVAIILAAAWTAYLAIMNAAFNTNLSLMRSPYVYLPWAGVALLALVIFALNK